MESSSVRRRGASNFGHGKFASKKIRPVDKRISFRDLAKLAARRKTERFLASRTGCDERTAARWLSGKSRPPGGAVYAVLADIFARIG